MSNLYSNLVCKWKQSRFHKFQLIFSLRGKSSFDSETPRKVIAMLMSDANCPSDIFLGDIPAKYTLIFITKLFFKYKRTLSLKNLYLTKFTHLLDTSVFDECRVSGGLIGTY